MNDCDRVACVPVRVLQRWTAAIRPALLWFRRLHVRHLRAIQFRPLEDRMLGLMLVEYIEDRSLRRVERHDLDHLSIVDLANIHVVV